MYFWYYLQFCILTLKNSQAKNVNIYFSTRSLYILGKNTSIYCSPIIVVYVHATGFFKVHPACHNIVYCKRNQNKKYLERLISMLWISQKLYVGA